MKRNRNDTLKLIKREEPWVEHVQYQSSPGFQSLQLGIMLGTAAWAFLLGVLTMMFD